VKRDRTFDSKDLFSGGVRLSYNGQHAFPPDLKAGVLLEAGFDVVTPNEAKDISSWVYDHATGQVDVIDNRAKGVACYDPRYTFVEKLQTISTKFRRQQQKKGSPIDFMRHYYDAYSLLQRPEVQAFVGTEPYKAHKARRFRGGDDPDISKNEAFVLSDPATRAEYEKAYAATSALYYGGKPGFEEILAQFMTWADRL
jgi:hypothetical protein